MKDCVSPDGHSWRATSFRIAAGSTPVACENEGCYETGFLVDAEPQGEAAQNPGRPGEELF